MAKKAETTEKKSPEKITLENEPLFETQTSVVPMYKISGDFYYYDGIRANGRTRICKNKKDIKKFPSAAYVVGWVCK